MQYGDVTTLLCKREQTEVVENVLTKEMDKRTPPKRLFIMKTQQRVDQRLSVIYSCLTALYGEASGEDAFKRLRSILREYRPRLRHKTAHQISERDSILITYGDQLQAPDVSHLQTLADFCEKHLAGLISGLHILPFFPSSSDDGFSVIDYRTLNPDLGTWEDVERLGGRFQLMFDAVINHVSVNSEWFQAFLRDDPKYQDYFITIEGNPDLSQVVRPRALPLLTRFDTPSGPKQVWTTFSEDQVDLNYRNPAVLLEIIEILLSYIAHGAEFIRLDAIAYLWKEIGTACIHLPQTHRVIQLFRAVLDEVTPYVMLITETNVPHAENISYFGDGHNEAQLVYNFALPPLVLHTFYTGDARTLSAWAAGLKPPSDQTSFFNFLASHDGIGINPVRGILSELEIETMIERVKAHGGLVSYKDDASGMPKPYELNINYFDALSNPNSLLEATGAKFESLDLQVERFISSQAIMLTLVGLPGIYFHSLFGSRGWPAGVELTGRSRSINRQKFERAELERKLADPSSLCYKIFDRYSQLLRARMASPAFHPHGQQHILDCGGSIFALARSTSNQHVLCLQNISSQPQTLSMDLEEIFGHPSRTGWLVDLITGERFDVQRKSPLRLRPYQILWLARDGSG